MGFWEIECHATETAYNAACDCIESIYGCSSGYDYSRHMCCNLVAISFYHATLYVSFLILITCLVACAIVLCMKRRTFNEEVREQTIQSTRISSVVDQDNLVFES